MLNSYRDVYIFFRRPIVYVKKLGENIRRANKQAAWPNEKLRIFDKYVK